MTGEITLRLIDVAAGDTIPRATVDRSRFNVSPNQLVIKNHDENLGMLDALVESGVVTPTGDFIQVPGGALPIVAMSPHLEAQWNDFAEQVAMKN